ncbi:MAG TPA: response regulator [Polyangia bacterium]|nr:response regulator [Polyangia bacterium]
MSAPAIMVVDDDPSVREALTDFLSDEGFRVRDAVNGADALAQLASSREVPALMILDLSMPVMTGYELLRQIKGDEHWSPFPVLVLSGTLDEGTLPCDIAQLRKPIDSVALVAMIRGILQERYPS